MNFEDRGAIFNYLKVSYRESNTDNTDLFELKCKLLDLSQSFVRSFEGGLPECNSYKTKIINFIKRIIRKCTRFLLKPYAEGLLVYQEKNCALMGSIIGVIESDKLLIKTLYQENRLYEGEISDLNRSIEIIETRNQLHSEFLKCIDNKILTQEKNVELLIKDYMKQKWSLKDHLLLSSQSDQDIVECDICNYTDMRKNYETKKTECIFGGGQLERYICPQCGVIFGPTKFTQLSQKEIDTDYALHYSGFSEGDSSLKELKAFYLLNPSKQGIYLNYGCGCWSESIRVLREEGFHVYGYDLYAPADIPFMISSKDELSKMRFDGIYSNDFIEHLLDPIQEFSYMKTLLKDAESKMSHSTSCYKYKHEYTRFHTHFFEGESLKYLCEKNGLKIVDKVDEIENNDFYCCVYQPVNIFVEYLPLMRVLDERNASKSNEGITLNPAGIMIGPYVNLPQGKYLWEVCIQSEINDIVCRITSQCGEREICNVIAQPGSNRITVDLVQDERDFEFTMANYYDKPVLINSLKLLKSYMNTEAEDA